MIAPRRFAAITRGFLPWVVLMMTAAWPQAVAVTVTVAARLDQFADESSWMITSIDGNNEYGSASYTLEDSNTVRTTPVELEVGEQYKFIMMDTYGDGFSNQKAWYAIFYGNTVFDTSTELVRHEDFTGFQEEIVFRVEVFVSRSHL